MSFDLHALSEQLATVVASVSAGVVRVHDPRSRGGSTGIAWDGDGLVVTAHHVLRHDDGIEVRLPDGTEAAAEVIGRDPRTDLALLRTGGGLVAPAWHPTDEVAVGHVVLALGRPGRSVRATWGLVSGVGGAWRTRLGGEVARYIDVDAGLPRGFSGGPLVDTGGRVLGMNTSGLTRGGTTLPGETVGRVVQHLLAGGSVERGYLGVGAYPVSLPQAVAEQAGQERASLVVAVEDDSPAQAAGILLGDALVSIDGAPTRGVAELASVLAGKSSGEEVVARLHRAGALIEVAVILGTRP